MTQTNSNHKAGRLIIVDDEAELIAVLCETLSGHGYETVGYTSAAEALAKLNEQDFDLLLTDLMMPEIGGIDLLQAALKIDPNIVGIVMTGQGTVPTAVEAMKAGAFDYIMKPFTLNSLLPVMSRAMEVRHLRTDNMQLRETVAIHELGQALAFSSDLNQILNKVTDAVLHQCDADEASIMLPTSDGKELIVAVARGRHAEQIGKRIPMGQGIAGWVAENRKPVTLNGEVYDERFTPINPRADIRAAVSIPLLVRGSLVGVLNVNITRPHRRFTSGQVKTLNMMVSVVAPILENARLYAAERRTDENFRRSLDDSPLGVRIVTVEGETIYANRAILDFCGYDNIEELKTNPVLKRYTPESFAEYQIRREKRKRGHYVPSEYDINIVRKDGEVRHLHIFRKEILWDGERQFQVLYNDVTERKQAEEALRESEEKYRTIIENMQEGYNEVDMKGNFTFFNESMRKILGYEREDLLGMNNRQYLDEENARKAYQVYNRVYRTGEPVKNLEWQIIRKDDDRRNIEVSISLVRNAEGHPTSFRGIVHDITERKLAEEALRSSEQRLSDIVEFLPDATLVIDKEGKVIAWNRAIEEITGVKAEDMLGKGDYEYALPFYGERRPILIDLALYPEPETAKSYTNIERKGDILFGESYTPSLRGKRAHLSATASVLRDINGEIVAAIECLRDNTEHRQAQEELRQAEERYRSIFDNAHGGIYRTTPEGRFIMVNPAQAKMFGYKTPEELMTSVTDIARQVYVNPEERTKVREMLEENGSVNNYETQFYRKDGSIFDVSLTIRVIRDEKGQILYYEGMNEHMTERKESIARIRKALGATIQAIETVS